MLREFLETKLLRSFHFFLSTLRFDVCALCVAKKIAIWFNSLLPIMCVSTLTLIKMKMFVNKTTNFDVLYKAASFKFANRRKSLWLEEMSFKKCQIQLWNEDVVMVFNWDIRQFWLTFSKTRLRFIINSIYIHKLILFVFCRSCTFFIHMNLLFGSIYCWCVVSSLQNMYYKTFFN